MTKEKKERALEHVRLARAGIFTFDREIAAAAAELGLPASPPVAPKFDEILVNLEQLVGRLP